MMLRKFSLSFIHAAVCSHVVRLFAVMAWSKIKFKKKLKFKFKFTFKFTAIRHDDLHNEGADGPKDLEDAT